MSWDDVQANCWFEACCGKDGRQLKAATEIMRDEVKLPPHKALAAATWLVQNRDFAPKGTLYGPPAPVTADELAAGAGLNPRQAEAVVAWLDLTSDCAPKGALYALKQEIARLARGQVYE